MRRLRLTWGALFLVPAIVLSAWIFAEMYVVFAAGYGWTQPEGPRWLFTLCFLVSYLFTVTMHEAGHVLASKRYGGRLGYVIIGARLGVHIEIPGERTNWQQARISFGGPALHMSAAISLIILGNLGGQVVLGVLVAGWMALCEALMNMAVPISRTSDASKLYCSLWRAALGRGGHPFWQEANA